MPQGIHTIRARSRDYSYRVVYQGDTLTTDLVDGRITSTVTSNLVPGTELDGRPSDTGSSPDD